MKSFLITCDPGLEIILEAELSEIEGCTFEPFEDFRGKRLAQTQSLDPLLKLRSAHNVIELLHRIPYQQKTIEGVREALEPFEIPVMEAAASFRVSSKRWGKHSFTSMDVMREAGGVFWRRYGTRVDLHNYEVNIQVDILHDEILLGLHHTPKSLAYRIIYEQIHNAPLKSTTAFGMLHLANLQPGETVLDPFCGSGTLLIEGALAFGSKCKWIGSDMFEGNIEGAKANAEANEVGALTEFVLADARELEATFSQVDVIATDPPYGLKSGKNIGLPSLYQKFLVSAGRILRPGGRLVVLTPKRTVLMDAIWKAGGFRLKLEKQVETGLLRPVLFVLEKV